jgi:UDP-glucose 4-epimerase
MIQDRPIVLVTGASGFVGGHLSPALSFDGWTVRRAVRRRKLSEEEIAIEGIGPTTDWSDALDGVQAVVHLAARVHHPHKSQEATSYNTVNTQGTLRLAQCALDAGVRQFVFVSTVLVHGRSNDGRKPFSESDVLTPQGSYGMSKAAAEAGLEVLARGGDMNVSVVRPPLVYGRGAKGNFALLVSAVKRGIPLPFAAIRNHRAFLSVENLTSFILQRLRNSKDKFETFLVADAEQVSTPEFVRRLARAAGTKPRMFSVPSSLLSGVLLASGHREAHESLIGSLELDISKALSTGWRPVVDLDEGLVRALQSDR